MNQILLNVLAHDPTKTPGIYLSFRWLLPLIPHLENILGCFMLPLLGTWLGCFFIDTTDLCDQLFSFNGLLYMGVLISMLPKLNASSKLWFDANLFTIICYLIYFAELRVIAFYSMELEYSISWLFDIGFSTTFTLLFYALLLCLRLTTPLYFRTIASIYLLTNLGNIIALSTLNPFYSNKIFICISFLFSIYLLFLDRHSLLAIRKALLPTLWDKNLMILRCLFWGALSVWIDYIALTPFYILETIAATESHHRKDSVLYYCKTQWESHKSSIMEPFKRMKHHLQRRMTICRASVQAEAGFGKSNASNLIFLYIKSECKTLLEMLGYALNFFGNHFFNQCWKVRINPLLYHWAN
jgi:hypothetical protein